LKRENGQSRCSAGTVQHGENFTRGAATAGDGTVYGAAETSGMRGFTGKKQRVFNRPS
jgi:hypothetical protein